MQIQLLPRGQNKMHYLTENSTIPRSTANYRVYCHTLLPLRDIRQFTDGDEPKSRIVKIIALFALLPNIMGCTDKRNITICILDALPMKI